MRGERGMGVGDFIARCVIFGGVGLLAWVEGPEVATFVIGMLILALLIDEEV